jgi:predicted Rdx family selenoprotein
MEPGDRGKFEVFVDGKKIAERKRGFIARLLDGGWPDEREVALRIKSMASA